MSRTTLATLLILTSLCSSSEAQTISFFGNSSLQVSSADAPTPWVDGGFGRLQAGDDGDDDADEALTGEVNLGLEWFPSRSTALFLHGVARGETMAVDTWTAGLVEAWFEALIGVGATHETRFRAGTMILPTSRENTGELWTSPYLVSFSAINSWIAEEIRPTGIDVQYKWDDGTRSIRVGGTGFVANDTPGTLLAWRGWAIGNRVTTLGEELPLPPLKSLPDSFPAQKRGTTPYGSELDGRIGWSARARFDLWSRLTVQGTHYDNRGDRGLYGDEYAWSTRFDLVAVELRPGAGFTFISELLDGSTRMGPLSGDRVEADFDALYILLSWSRGWFRISARYDEFTTSEVDFSNAENNDEDGTAAAVAIAIQPAASFRVAVEYLDMDVERAASVESNGPLQNGGDAVLVHVRYSF